VVIRRQLGVFQFFANNLRSRRAWHKPTNSRPQTTRQT
jgi:hypothetical protein